jgi:hypothetical protein
VCMGVGNCTAGNRCEVMKELMEVVCVRECELRRSGYCSCSVNGYIFVGVHSAITSSVRYNRIAEKSLGRTCIG